MPVKLKHPKRFSSLLAALVLGITLFLPGVFFTGALWRSFEKGKQQQNWPQSRARILYSEIVEEKRSPSSPASYRLELSYSYQFEGRDYTGHRRKLIEGSTHNLRKVKRWQRKYRVGSERSCYLQPEQPEVAVLEPQSKAALYSIWYPALFALGGLGVIFGSLFSYCRRQ